MSQKNREEPKDFDVPKDQNKSLSNHEDHTRTVEEWETHIKKTKEALREMESKGFTAEELDNFLDKQLNAFDTRPHTEGVPGGRDAHQKYDKYDLRTQETLTLLAGKIPEHIVVKILGRRVSNASAGHSAQIVEHIYQAAIDVESDVKNLLPPKISEYFLS